MGVMKKVGEGLAKLGAAIFTGICFAAGYHAYKTATTKLDENQVGEKAIGRITDGVRWVTQKFSGKKDDCGTACEAPQQPESPATE